MTKSFYSRILPQKIRFEKIKTISSLRQLKNAEGFTLVELIVVVMMIGILSSIAIPQFMTAADKAKQKEATGIVSALIKAATAYQTEYGVLPINARELSEYAKFQGCYADNVGVRGGAVCKTSDNSVIRPVPGDDTSFYSTTGNYFVQFSNDEDGTQTQPLFQVLANPNGNPYSVNGSAVAGCYNPVYSISEVYEHTSADKGEKTWRACLAPEDAGEGEE